MHKWNTQTIAKVFILSLLTVVFQQIHAFSLSFDAPIPTAHTQPFDKTMEFYHAYLNTLYLVDPNLVFRYSIGNPESVQFLIDDLKKEAEIVQKFGLNQMPYAQEYDQKAFERMAVPRVFQYLMRTQISIPESEVEKVLRTNPESYPAQEMFYGWEILVEVSDQTDTSTLSQTLESIRQQLAKEPFQWVATKYYWTIGTDYDGSLGMVKRGDIPDWEFDIFLAADPSAPFFGPIRNGNVYVFGKLYKKYTRNANPVDTYGETIRTLLQSQAAKQKLDEFFKTQKEKLKPEVFQFDHASTRGLDQIAYRFNNYEITFRQVLARLPQYTGNPKDPRFYDAMAKHTFEEDLVNFSSEADRIRKTPEFKFMAEANLNAWLVNRHVKIQLDNFPKDEAAFKIFYKEQAEKFYSSPDLVKLLVLSSKRDPNEDNDPILKHSSRKPDFIAALRLKEAYEKNPCTATAQELARADSAVKWKMGNKEVPADSLGRVLEMGIKDIPEGGIVGPLVGKSEYLVVHVISRRKQPVMTFEKVLKRLPGDYMIHCKRKILRDLYETDRVNDYF